MLGKKLCLLSLVTMLSSTAIYAEDLKDNFNNPVHYGVNSLSIAPDARGASMGDIGAATEADCNSQFWNPAKYPFNIARAGISLNYTPWLRKLVNDIHLLNVAGFYRMGEYNSLSASLRYFSLGEVYTSQSDDAMTIKPYEFAFDVAYSRMLSERFSMSVAMRYIFSDMSNNYEDGSKPGNAFAADISMYRLGYFNMGRRECSFGWGLNINNIGTKINYGASDHSDFLPTNLRLGINMTVPFNEYNRLSISADANKLLIPTYPRYKEGDDMGESQVGDPIPENDPLAEERYYDMSPVTAIFKSFYDAPGGFKEEMQEIQWSAGMEYNYNDRFMLRFGYHHEAAIKGNRKYVTAGAGFHMSVFTIDAAYVFSTSQSNPLDQTMRVSLGFDLDGMKDLFGKKKGGRRR